MIEDKDILKAIEEVRKNSKRRGFIQTFELAINLRYIDPKKPENKIEEFVVLPKGRGKDIKVCAFVSNENYEKAKQFFDLVIKRDDMEKIASDKRKCKKIAKNYDYFVAEAPLMGLVGRFFGKYLAPRGKLPNPKGKMIFPPNANYEEISKRIKNTVRIKFDKRHQVIHVPVGTENMKDKEILENIKAVLNTLINALPKGWENIDSIYLKLTMGPGARVK